MIFVTLGTQDKPFRRLLDYVENSSVEDRIVAQCGFTEYSSDKMEIVSYLDKDQFDRCVDEADIVICHGGVGTLISCLDKGKKVIVCARRGKYGEHQNDHQQQIVDIFTNGGYVRELNEDNSLDELIEEMKDFTVRSYSHNNQAFVSKLRDYIV